MSHWKPYVLSVVCCLCLCSAKAAPIYQQVQLNDACKLTYVLQTGKAPFIWSVTAGQLPSGVMLNASSGALTGTFSSVGLYDFQLTVTDSSSPAITSTQSVAIQVIDASSPPPPPVNSPVIDALVSADSGKSLTLSAPALSTSGNNELLLAFVSADSITPDIQTTVSNVSGGGLNWSLVQRVNRQAGDTEIWRALAPVPLSNVKVTAALTQLVASSITVASFLGVDASMADGSAAVGALGSGDGNPGVPSASLRTTRNNSLVLGVGQDYTTLTPRTLGQNQTLLHQDLAAGAGVFWVQKQNGPTPLAGTTVTISDLAPGDGQFNLNIVEIRAPAGVQPQPTLTINSPTNGQTVSGTVTIAASASNALSSATVQFTLDGSNLGQVMSGSTYSYSWNTASVPNGSHTIGAILRDSSGNSVTASLINVTVGNSPPPPPLVSTTLVLNPTSISFGDVSVGSSKSQSGTLTAQGGSVMVSSGTLAGSGYSLSGLTFPLTLTNGQSVAFAVAFAPSASGQSNGTVNFLSNANNPPGALQMAGNGVASVQHSVDLSWEASTSQVAGYNMYRSSQAGGPYMKINSQLVTGLTFNDNSVQAGATYFYVVTSVDPGSNESVWSNEAQAVIDTP